MQAAHARPTEGWILAGVVDGAATIELATPVAGLPHVVRLACDLAFAGVRRIFIVWTAAGPPPDLTWMARDPRLVRATVHVVTTAPDGPGSDDIVVLRADRVYHRELPARAIAAWTSSPAQLAKIAGESHDAVLVTFRDVARSCVVHAAEEGGLAAVLARLAVAHEVIGAESPYLAFTARIVDRSSLREAERQLVWSLRKSADGIAAKLLNRRLSLPMSRLLAPTRIHPNHVTLIALACALVGALLIGRGGYRAGVLGMLCVELGSIVDGIDGELARLRFQFSRTGQWLDTVVDDVANVAYLTGVIVSLHAGGEAWALPFGLACLTAFAITQSAQYVLIAKVYGSGDLATIPWAFQSTEILSKRASSVGEWIRLTAPKLLKRDFVVSGCVIAALVGRLDVILVVVGSGALVFFAVFWVQLARNVDDIARHRGMIRARSRP